MLYPMKAHVELSCWIDLTEDISKGELERLLATIGVYLTSCKGIPVISSFAGEDSLCITAYALPGEAGDPLKDAVYIKEQVLEALTLADMIVGE